MADALYDGEYYKVVRLKTGESILCSMDNDVKSLAAENYLHLQTPVQVLPHQESRRGNQVVGESYLLRPWIGLSDSDKFVISTDMVLTIGDLKKEVKEQYLNYLHHTAETRRKIEEQDAINQLLLEVNGGEVHIINDEEYYDEEDRD